MDLQKEREAFEAWHYEQYLLENPNIDISNAKYIYDYAHKNALVCQLKESHFTVWQAAKAKADQKIKLLLCDEHLKKCESPTGVFNSQYPDEEPCLICLAKQAKAQAVPEGFVLVSAEQMSQWGHMANYAEQYGCPECFEARGYAHNLGCEINAYFNASEAQEPAND